MERMRFLSKQNTFSSLLTQKICTDFVPIDSYTSKEVDKVVCSCQKWDCIWNENGTCVLIVLKRTLLVALTQQSAHFVLITHLQKKDKVCVTVMRDCSGRKMEPAILAKRTLLVALTQQSAHFVLITQLQKKDKVCAAAKRDCSGTKMELAILAKRTLLVALTQQIAHFVLITHLQKKDKVCVTVMRDCSGKKMELAILAKKTLLVALTQKSAHFVLITQLQKKDKVCAAAKWDCSGTKMEPAILAKRTLLVALTQQSAHFVLITHLQKKDKVCVTVMRGLFWKENGTCDSCKENTFSRANSTECTLCPDNSTSKRRTKYVQLQSGIVLERKWNLRFLQREHF